MDSSHIPTTDTLYFDNTFGEIPAIENPEALAAQAWLTVWAVLSPIDGCGSDGWEASIVLADDDHVRTLNKAFRGKDKATNVLSFPDGEMSIGADALPLGDIIIAVPTVLREAEEQEKTPRNHLCHLMVHGLLHLCGYDHESEDEAQVMEDAEIRILAHLGVPNPYEEDTRHE